MDFAYFLKYSNYAPFPCKDWSGLLTDSRGKGASYDSRLSEIY